MYYFVKKANTAYILVGGEFIGTGAFGCVFNPDIKNKDQNIVSKLVMRDEGIKEAQILEKIKNDLTTNCIVDCQKVKGTANKIYT